LANVVGRNFTGFTRIYWPRKSLGLQREKRFAEVAWQHGIPPGQVSILTQPRSEGEPADSDAKEAKLQIV
jgi:hypothetical protein